MKNKNTKYRNANIKATIIASIILIIITAFIVCFLFHADNILEIFVCFLLLSLIVMGLIGSFLGIIKGKRQVAKENKYIKKTNPYIYYRELPNNFGIGITSLLIDSTIENYKDIVAVILDLCAKKYIRIIKQDDKYIIKILKKIDDNLLNNEKYILSSILNNDIKNVNYQEWYNYCMEDGMNLGLYYRNEVYIDNKPPLTQDIVNKRRKVQFLISLVSGILTFIIFMSENILKAFGYGIVWFGLTYAILIVLFYLINVFTGFKNIAKQSKDINYKTIRENTLTKTNKGIEELHKLYSFKAFLSDFGSFVDKKPEEVILWDRYLSYAQVFGLTKEIMNSGYKQLVDNSSFQIDSIDNITINNIELEK